jgi:hypothetical protein
LERTTNMEAINLLTGYAEKLKASEKQLKSLERKAKALAQKQAETDEQRIYLEAKITDHRRDAASLHSENADLQLQYIKAVYEQDVSAQRDVQARRQEIEASLQEHGRAVEELNEALEKLPSFEQESAELAKEIEALSFGDGWRFARQVETALVQNQNALKSRQGEAKSKLPSFSEATRRQVDTAYREKREREEAEQARAEAQREAEAEKAKLTNRVVRDDEGIVIGVRSFDEEGNFVKYTEAKMVSGKR